MENEFKVAFHESERKNVQIYAELNELRISYKNLQDRLKSSVTKLCHHIDFAHDKMIEIKSASTNERVNAIADEFLEEWQKLYSLKL